MLPLLLFWLAQTIEVPAKPGRDPFPQPADASSLSLVVADAVSQGDPRPLCGDPACTSLFLGRFAQARTLTGVPLATAFDARLEMGSPFDRRYRLLLIVERRASGELVVRAGAGFNARTSEACVSLADAKALDWSPAAAGVSRRGQSLCFKEP